MRRVFVSVVVSLLIASSPILAVSHPAVAGNIAGIELCPQSICGVAAFAGNFAGTVNSKPTAGIFWAGITHGDLPTEIGETAPITGGTWMIRTATKVVAGTVEAGGTLTYNGGNTFTVDLTMDLTTGGNGTLTFTGVLDHNPFPPTIAGTISQ